MEHFGTWLTEQLQQRDWSMSELARRCGVSHATISRIIGGSQNPSPELCREMARALTLSPETVFRKAGLLPPEPDSSDPLLNEAVHLFQQLPEEERRTLLIQMRALVEAKGEGREGRS
jgi:transcriptional regulator with XRE-family HTH domain